MATPIYSAGMPAEKQYQFSSITQQLRADNIIVKDRERELDEQIVMKIYERIAEHGLIQPICVRAVKDQPGYNLIVGAHRLEAWMRRWNEGDKNDRAHQRRWGDIPCIVYQNDMTEEQMKLIELRENLERSELTPDQRNEMAAQILEMESKKTKSSFSVPTQKKVAEMLKVNTSTFKSQFKSYMVEADLAVNWTKLDEEQYNGFIKWFRDGRPTQPKKTKSSFSPSPKKAKAAPRRDVPPPADPDAVEVTLGELEDEKAVIVSGETSKDDGLTQKVKMPLDVHIELNKIIVGILKLAREFPGERDVIRESLRNICQRLDRMR